MTSSAAGIRATTPDHGSRAARLVAATTALALALVVLAVPGARAQADEPVATTLTVTQEETWWEGSGAKRLLVETRTPDGELAPGGSVVVTVEGHGQVGGVSGHGGGRVLIHADLDAGTYPASVRYHPAAGYAGATWTGTVTVTAGTITSTTTVRAPAALAFGEGGSVDVAVTADGAVPQGTVSLRRLGSSGGVAQASLSDGTARLTIPESEMPGTSTYEVVHRGRDGIRSSRATFDLTISRAERDLQVWSPDGKAWSQDDDWWKVAVDIPDVPLSGGTLSLYRGSRLLESMPVASWPRTEVFVLRAGDLPPGKHGLDVRLTGSPTVESTSARFDVEVVRVESAVNVLHANGTLRWGTKHELYAVVGAARDSQLNDDHPTTGTVSVYRGSTKVGSARIGENWDARVRIAGDRLPVGRSTLRVVYSGDGRYSPSSRTISVRVRKAETKVRAKVLDRRVEGSQRVKVRVRASSPSHVTVTGTLKVKVDGKVVKTVRLKKKHDGERRITLPRLSRQDHHRIKVVLAKTPTTKRAVSPQRWVWVS